jgi:hypothetical protein
VADDEGFDDLLEGLEGDAREARRRLLEDLVDDGCPMEDIRAAVAEWPDWCAEQWWGTRLAAVRVTLADCDPDALAELLEDAWRGARPAR